jgi:hypothetical protein
MTQILRLVLAATLAFLIPAAAAAQHPGAGAHAPMPPPIVAPLPPAPSTQMNSPSDRALRCQQTGSAAGVSPGQLGGFTSQCIGD